MKTLFIPTGKFMTDDAAAIKRKELAEKLRRGEEVSVTHTGQIVPKSDSKVDTDSMIEVKPAKLASIRWYQNDPELLKSEKDMMKKYFPYFQMDKLDDGRLCWYGNLNPRGRDGSIWYLQLVYDNNHPHNNTYGGSLRVYSIKPDLDELCRSVGGGLPHLLNDPSGKLCICTARKEDVDDGVVIVTSAAQALTWASKWIFIFESWLDGDVGDEAFDHIY
jgi:hypothetical protein